MQDDELIIHGPLLLATAKRQCRNWIGRGILAFGLLLLAELLFVAQSYTATTSVVIQQASVSNSPLALLGGGGTGNRYLGILKSRQAAASVEQLVNLQQIEHLSSADAAIGQLMAGIKPDDTAADGLLYIHLTLTGPARLAVHSRVSRSQIEDAAAQAANAYATVLHDYYVNNDNEEGSVLLRGADEQERKAQADYDAALAQEFSFARSLRRVDPRAGPSATMEAAATAGPEISALYATLAQVEAQINQAEAVQATQQAQVNRQLGHIGEISSEDPLLAQARNRVALDQRDLNALNLVDGPDNPDVIRATERLQTDQDALARQVEGIRGSVTTENTQQTASLEGLRARETTLRHQITAAERRLGISRELSGRFERLGDKLAIQREILETTVTEATKVRLENASAQSRTEVVDTALPPASGEPGISRFAEINIFLILLLLAASIVRSYLSQARLLAAEVPASIAGKNGSGPSLESSADEINHARQKVL